MLVLKFLLAQQIVLEFKLKISIRGKDKKQMRITKGILIEDIVNCSRIGMRYKKYVTKKRKIDLMEIDLR